MTLPTSDLPPKLICRHQFQGTFTWLIALGLAPCLLRVTQILKSVPFTHLTGAFISSAREMRQEVTYAEPEPVVTRLILEQYQRSTSGQAMTEYVFYFANIHLKTSNRHHTEQVVHYALSIRIIRSLLMSQT